MEKFPPKNKCFTVVTFKQWHWLTLGLALFFILHWESIAINIWREGLRGSVVNLFYKHIRMSTHLMTLMKDFHPANSDRCNGLTIISIKSFLGGISRPVYFNSIILLFCISNYIVNAIIVLWEVNIPGDCHCIWKSAAHYLIRRQGAGGGKLKLSQHSASHPQIRARLSPSMGSTASLRALPTPWLYGPNLRPLFTVSCSQHSLPHNTSPQQYQCQRHCSCHLHKHCERTPSCFHEDTENELLSVLAYAFD